MDSEGWNGWGRRVVVLRPRSENPDLEGTQDSWVARPGAPGVDGDLVGLEGGFGAGELFGPGVIEPPGVGHGGAGGEHADPGAMGGLGEEDGDAEAAGEDGEAGDVVLMLVGDEDGVELCGVFAGEGPCGVGARGRRGRHRPGRGCGGWR